jgi:hypothetical protein
MANSDNGPSSPPSSSPPFRRRRFTRRNNNNAGAARGGGVGGEETALELAERNPDDAEPRFRGFEGLLRRRSRTRESSEDDEDEDHRSRSASSDLEAGTAGVSPDMLSSQQRVPSSVTPRRRAAIYIPDHEDDDDTVYGRRPSEAGSMAAAAAEVAAAEEEDERRRLEQSQRPTVVINADDLDASRSRGVTIRTTAPPLPSVPPTPPPPLDTRRVLFPDLNGSITNPLPTPRPFPVTTTVPAMTAEESFPSLAIDDDVDETFIHEDVAQQARRQYVRRRRPVSIAMLSPAEQEKERKKKKPKQYKMKKKRFATAREFFSGRRGPFDTLFDFIATSSMCPVLGTRYYNICEALSFFSTAVRICLAVCFGIEK